MTELLLDAAGRRRPPATMPGFRAGCPPRNKGVRDPADPPTIEEVVAVTRAAATVRTDDGCARGSSCYGAGLRINEALAFAEPGLDRRRGVRTRAAATAAGSASRYGRVGLGAA